MKLLPTKSARRRLTIGRDVHGVPHISANTWREALYGLGYMHAIDRPTQMLFSRAIASGQSAELIADKPELREMDYFFRRVGLYLNLEEEVRNLDDDTFDQLTAYCEGVNDGMKDAGRSLPMWAVGFVPQPWNQRSVLLLGNLLSFGGLIVGQLQNERILLDLIQAGVAPDKMRELFSPLLDDVDFDLLRHIRMTSQLSDEALELITDLPRLAGSNAWAVSPKRSATGSPLLASDPHLEINRLPAIWYEAELHWGPGGEEYALGATLPGCPLFAVARTRQVAWGVTYLKGDTADHFIEDCRTDDDGQLQYRRGDRWHAFQVRDELIGRKGRGPDSLPVYYNDQGTLDVATKPTENGHYLSTTWIGDQIGVGRAISTWLDLVSAEDAAEGMEIAGECPSPTLCWVFADREGHIGMQASGWFPRRGNGHHGLTPIPAWDARNHWRGRLSTSSLPRVYDPPEGFVATANENINEPGGPMLITQPVPAYRKRRIVERLRQMPSATIEDMQQLQYDVVSVQARDLLQVFLPCMPEGPIKERLSSWDCSYSPDSYEATLFSRLYRNVLLEIFGHEHGIGWRRMLYLCSRVGFSTMVLTAIDNLLLQEDSLWWRDRDKASLIRHAADKLAGEKEQPWSAINGFHFTNRFVESRFVGRAFGFHTREMALPGCYATPFQGHLLRAARREASFAPSYHFVTDVGTDEAWTNLPGGPSESRLSGYYKNDIPRWHNGHYKRLCVETLESSKRAAPTRRQRRPPPCVRAERVACLARRIARARICTFGAHGSPVMLEGMNPTGVPDDATREPLEAVPPFADGVLISGTQIDATIGSEPALPELTAADLRSPRARRIFLPVVLFVATCFATFFVGAFGWDPTIYFEPGQGGRVVAPNWENGLIYMAAVIGILLTHEMGHFLQTVRYHVPASLPYFIPVPMILTGTMGAVIGMEGSRADRKQLFDIGLSGPIAGLIVALPIIWFGIQRATVAPSAADFQLGDPLIFKLMTAYLRPDIAPDAILNKNNPLLMAGWVGMLITGLNMLPISQLDGGHVIYGLFGRRAHLVARAFLIAAILFVVVGEHYNWTVMLVLVILLGVDHPPTRDDNVRLGPLRTAVGLASLAIPVLCFTPVLVS